MLVIQAEDLAELALRCNFYPGEKGDHSLGRISTKIRISGNRNPKKLASSGAIYNFSEKYPIHHELISSIPEGPEIRVVNQRNYSS